MNKKNNFRKMLSLTAIAGFTFFAIASGSGGDKDEKNYDKNVQIKPYETKIKGYLSNVFEIQDGSYKFDYTGNKYMGKGKIQIKIKSIGQGDLKDYGLLDGNNGPLYLTICDKNGTPLTDFSDIASDYNGDDLLKDMMTKIGEENWIPFQASTYQGKRLPDEAATFIITSKKIEKREDSSNSNNIFSNEEVSVTSGGENWDKMLDDYEEYVDKYIEFLRKANDGDMSAMTEYTSLMGKATQLQKSMKKAQKDNNLNVQQIERVTKIQNKMLKAASEMKN